MVPRIGIIGAAIATLVSYGITSTAMGVAGRRLLRVALPWATILRAGVVALVMYLAVRNLLPGHRLLSVGLRIVVGAPTYALLIALVDTNARGILRKGLARVRPRKDI